MTVMAPGGIDHAGLSILASRWTEAIRMTGSPCELLLGKARRHPDEAPAEEFLDMADAIRSWHEGADGAARLLVVGLPTDWGAARSAISALADLGERATLLWEQPATPILDLAAVLEVGPPPGVRVATLNRRFVSALRDMFPDSVVAALPLALPQASFEPRPGSDGGAPFAIAVGRLTSRKGAARLCTLWSEHVGPRLGLKLVMLGSGHGAADSEEDRVRAVAGSSAWIECEEIGPLAHRLARIRAATCAVFAAVDDHLPQALAEAMAVESPVVVTPIAGHLELVEDHMTGFVLDDLSLADLGEAIEKNVVEDPLAARRAAAAAADRVQRLFAPPVAGRAVLSYVSS